MRKAKLQRPTVHSFMSPPKKLFFSFRSRNQTAKAVRSAAPRSKEPNWSWSTRSTRARTTYAPSYSTSSNSSNNSSNSSSNNNNSSSSNNNNSTSSSNNNNNNNNCNSYNNKL